MMVSMKQVYPHRFISRRVASRASSRNTARRPLTGADAGYGEGMANLTPLDEKLAEVLGLAQAAQAATETVSAMEDAEDFGDQLVRMREQAAETEQRTDELIGRLEGRKTAIRDMARETKAEATDMMKTYLEGEEEALDGFEWLSMAEAGELCHWEIVETMSERVGETAVHELATWAVDVQREHVKVVRRAALELAVKEAATA
jgi:hypothetical protein